LELALKDCHSEPAAAAKNLPSRIWQALRFTQVDICVVPFMSIAYHQIVLTTQRRANIKPPPSPF
jgi:hypothetical protein|tara:strand:+ start:453 stop:647 length:195 start_codon:yes stop_codon:yes gene_type:complete